MTAKKTDNREKEENIFTSFFKEESQKIFEKSENEGNIPAIGKKVKIPELPESIPAEKEEILEEWKALRKFFVSSQGGGSLKDIHPIYVHPSTLSGTLHHYPVWITENLNGKNSDTAPKCGPLYTIITKGVNDLYPGPDQGKMLKNMLPVILNKASETVRSNSNCDFPDVFERASVQIKDKMKLRGADRETFETQIVELKTKIPAEGSLIPYSKEITFKILEAACSNVSVKGKNELSARIKKVLTPLMDLIAIEMENDPESVNPDHLEASMDFAGNYLDFEKLSSVLPESSSEHISAKRFERIKNIISELDKGSKVFASKATVILQKELLKSGKRFWDSNFKEFEIIEEGKGAFCSRSLQIYNDKVTQYARLIKTIRIGELEIQDKYIKEVHEDFFDAFDWNYFNEAEMSFFPPILIISDSRELIRNEFDSFSALLHKGIPVNIIGLISDVINKNDTPIDPVSLAISYRNSYVVQSTCLNSYMLFERFEEGISMLAPSFFHIAISKSDNEKDAIIELNACVESRVFPEFVYNGKVGTAWGSRFYIKDNPQTKNDWPAYTYTCQNMEGKEVEMDFVFTYADFVALNTTHQSEFRVLDPRFWTEDLILFSEYLQLNDKDRYGKVPYIWMVNDDSKMVKAAVSWNIVTRGIERLDYWHYLQDCGGINSYHAKKALKEQEEKIRKEAEAEINTLKEQFNSDLEKVKKESTEEAMEHLTSALLDLDTDSIISAPLKKDPSGSTKESTDPGSQVSGMKSQEETIQKDEEEEEVEEEFYEDPWIETPLCTNCNECIDINNRMFNYNSNKLAFINDPKAGTYAQLVEAAEKCPVSIIHPGKPLDPKEPDLEDLIKRASKYN